MPDYRIVNTYRDGASLTVGFSRNGLHLRASVTDHGREIPILDITLTDDVPSVVQGVNLHSAIERMIYHRQVDPAPFCLDGQRVELCRFEGNNDTPWAFVLPKANAIYCFPVTEEELETLDRALVPWTSEP